MPSKFDQLRQGNSVEIKPGLSGRLNKDKKTLELSTGQVLNVGHNKNFFPADEKDLALSKQREYVGKGVEGPAGEFLHQFTTQGLIGGGKDWIDYITQPKDVYDTRKTAERELSQRISEESPYISGAATAASFVPDIYATRGLSALKAAPLITAGAAGSRIITEPQEVASEAALSAGLGYGIDKAGNYFNRVAQRRAAIRNLPAQQENVRNSNIAGQQAVDQANAQQVQQFNIGKQQVKSSNEAALKQHEIDLNARQNRMLQSKNSYEQAKAARDAQVIKLKNDAEIAKAQRSANAAQLEAQYQAELAIAKQEEKRLADEFKLAQTQYKESLSKMPELQRKAQAEYSSNVVRNAQEIEKSFPKNSRISTDELGVDNFIEDSIQKTGIAGTTEANQARRVLRSLFPEDELLTAKDLSNRYKAIEDAIQRASPEVQQVLNNFKNHLGQKLPAIVQDSVAYTKIMPLLKKTLENDVRTIIQEIGFEGVGAETYKKSMLNMALSNAKSILRNDLSSANFVSKLQNGELSRDLANKILTVEDFLSDVSQKAAKDLRKQGTFDLIFQDAQRKHSYFVSELSQVLEKRLARYEIKAMQSAQNASKKLGQDVRKTYGLAESVEPPVAPSPPSAVAAPNMPASLPPVPPVQIPPPIMPPGTPPLPNKPSLLPDPTPPIPQSFNAVPEPTLAPAQGFADTSGDFLEKNLLGGKTIMDNPITKLAGLKYLLGKAALPAEAAYGAMKVLTSPGSAGQAARMTFKQGGIQAVVSWASKYPSFHDGILENPQERRSLTKEIEDSPDIPIEQKAMLQSKVNRGKPLEGAL